jgi:hypothetical protein
MNNYRTIIDKISRKVDKYLSDLLADRASSLTEDEASYYRDYPQMFIYDTVPFMLDFYRDINKPNTIILFEEISLEGIEDYVDLELTEEERNILTEERFRASLLRVEDYFKVYTAESF